MPLHVPMSKCTFYPLRKVRIIVEYCTSRFKRDNSHDSCISALPNPSQSVTTNTPHNVASFAFGTNVHAFCSNPVPMCSGTDASGAYLPVKFSTEFIHFSTSCPLMIQLLLLWCVAWQKKDINNGFWLLVIYVPQTYYYKSFILSQLAHLVSLLNVLLSKTFSHPRIGLFKLQQMQI